MASRKRANRRNLIVESLEPRALLATFTVTNNANAGVGTLRQAILNANANAGLDTIQFALPNGSTKISLSSALPWIEESVVIDGTTQSGFTQTPIVQIDGATINDNSSGLVLNKGSSTIKGLAFTRFATGLWINSSGNVVSLNFLGLQPDQTAAGNRFNGLYIQSASNNTITRNVASANGTEGIRIDGAQSAGNRIQGNAIGTDASGVIAIANQGDGVLFDSTGSNLIGTDGDGLDDATEGNIISGNRGNGIRLFKTSNARVSGNLIGTDLDGSTAIPNAGAGIVIDGLAANSLVGTDGDGVSDALEGNVISGNVGNGIHLDTSVDSIVAGNLIGLSFDGSMALANDGSGILVHGGDLRARIGSDGDGLGDEVEGNFISGNGAHGVAILQSNASSVAGNVIGLAADGLTALGNKEHGVWVSSTAMSTRIGFIRQSDFDTIVPNVISGNAGHGIASLLTNGLAIAGNMIGADITGTTKIGNGMSGIFLGNDVVNATVGATGRSVEGSFSNVVVANGLHGIQINGSARQIKVQGNLIGQGLDASAMGNTLSGIQVANGATAVQIGGDSFDAGNFISDNGQHGIHLLQANENLVLGNNIGLSSELGTPLENKGAGLYLDQSSRNTIGFNPANEVGLTAGAENWFSRNGKSAIVVVGNQSRGNIFGHNFFSDSLLPMIDLADNGLTPNDANDADEGPNALQNFPIIQTAATSTSVTDVSGVLQGEPASLYRLDFYIQADSGDGTLTAFAIDWLEVTTDETGAAAWSMQIPEPLGPGDSLRATATNVSTGTSEFSPAVNATTMANLGLTLNNASVEEGVGTIQLTIHRGSIPLNQPVAIELTSSDPSSATVAAGVVIDANQNSVTVPVTIKNDSLINGDRPVSITASAFGVAFGTVDFEIVDDDTTWHNAQLQHDVNDDGLVTSLDVLLIVSLLIRHNGGVSIAVATKPQAIFYGDVNDDGNVSPVDAVLVIGVLVRSGGSAGEGEAPSEDAISAAAVDAALQTPMELDDTAESRRMHILNGFRLARAKARS